MKLSKLASLEKQIETGIRGVGEALTAIRDGKLYQANYETFDEYCKERWNFKRDYAYKLIKSSETAANLYTIVDKLEVPTEVPTKESHLREIAKAPEKKQVEVLERGNEIAEKEGREPVAADYKAAVEEVVEPAKTVKRPTVDTITDKAGREVPPEFLAEAGFRASLATVANKIARLSTEIDAMADELGGEFLWAQVVVDLLTQAKDKVSTAGYYTHCPRCDREPNCKLCEGLGWMPDAHKGYMSNKDREAIGCKKKN